MAFKMNREGFTFYTKPKSPKTHKHGLPKYGHDKGLTKYDDTHMTKTIAKPDYIDIDGDGNKKEAMKDAAKNIKEQTPNVASNLTKTPYEKNKYSHATKTIAKDKDFNEKMPEREDPLFEGGDIPPSQFKTMSIKEIKELYPDMTIQQIRKIKNKLK